MPKISDPDLYESLKELLSSVIREIKTKQVPKKKVLKTRKQSDGSIKEKTIPEPDYQKLMSSFSRENRWRNFSNYSECLKAFHSSDLFRKHINNVKEEEEQTEIDKKSLSHEEIITSNLLPDIFVAFSKEVEELKFNEDIFQKIYLEFENYLDSGVVKFVSYATLDKFDMNKNRLELGSQGCIREITDEERGKISEYSRSPLGIVDFREVHNDFMIEKTFTVEKGGSRNLSKAKDFFATAISALRLFSQGGDVNYGALFTKPKSHFGSNVPGTSVAGSQKQITSLRGEAKLSEEDCETFSDFWKQHNQMLENPEGFTKQPLNKFNDAFSRNELADKFLDLVIALESLLLKDGEMQELKYRLSQRGALLLTEEAGEEVEIRDNINEAYKKRSKIVHRGQSEVDRDFLKTICNLTRKVILQFLEEKRQNSDLNHKSLINKLDQAAIKPIDLYSKNNPE